MSSRAALMAIRGDRKTPRAGNIEKTRVTERRHVRGIGEAELTPGVYAGESFQRRGLTHLWLSVSRFYETARLEPYLSCESDTREYYKPVSIEGRGMRILSFGIMGTRKLAVIAMQSTWRVALEGGQVVRMIFEIPGIGWAIGFIVRWMFVRKFRVSVIVLICWWNFVDFPIMKLRKVVGWSHVLQDHLNF